MAAGFRRFLSNVKAESFIHNTVVSVTAAVTITRALHAGRTVKLDLAAGFATTLPAATGTAARYRFVIGTVATGDHTIKVADSTDVMAGGILINNSGDSAAATADFYPTAAASDTITLDASEGAGKIGDWIELEDVATNLWTVRGVFQGVADPATPFSAAV